MSDYIKREDAIKLACSDCEPYSCDKNCTLMQILKMTPAADVVEKRLGRWLYKKVEPQSPYMWRDLSPEIVCSKCKQHSPWEYRYCPNCGAKMANSAEMDWGSEGE